MKQMWALQWGDFADCSWAVLLLCVICVVSFLCLLFFRVRLFVSALWSPAGRGLASWLSFVVSGCEWVPFPLMSLVRCVT